MTLRHSSRDPGALSSWNLESEFARDVSQGLNAPQKVLPARYLYDDVGSALFEAITRLPEYGLTRAEERLLYSHAEEITWQAGPISTVAELGSGTGMKTQWLLEAITEQRKDIVYFAIDVSNASLEKCRDHLLRVPGVEVRTLYATYLEGLAKVRHEKPRSGRMLVLFLGSSLGNFYDGEAALFLKQARQYLLPGDAILLGADLVKSPGALINAYDDPAGVTSAFNLNLLSRINRELGGNFQLRSFRHDVRWRPLQNRIDVEWPFAESLWIAE